MSKNIHDFLKDYKSTQKDAFTHTSLAGGSYNVPDSALPQFFKLYTLAFCTDGVVPLHLSERHAAIGPLLIDLDFRQSSNKRLYDMEAISYFLSIYTESILEYVQCPTLKEGLEFFVLEKGDGPRPHQDAYKDGVHIIAPSIVTAPCIQEKIRAEYISNNMPNEHEEYVFKDFSNPLEDIVDERVISKNNWLMYGSNKPCDGDDRYLVTHRIMIKDINDELVYEYHPIEDKYDVAYIKMFSIRNKTKCSVYTSKGNGVISANKRTQAVEEKFRLTSVSGQTVETTPLSITTATKTMTDEQLACALVDILKSERADKYDTWIQVGLCLHNISDDLLDKWIEFSKRSCKYIKGECEKTWKNYFVTKSDGLNIGTLRMWARQDSPDEYWKIIQNNIMTWVFKSVNGSHTDVACVVRELYGNIYKCVKIQPSVWYEYSNHRWCSVDHAYSLRALMSKEVCKLYLVATQMYLNKAHSIDVDETKAKDDEVMAQITALSKSADKYKKIAFQLKNAGFKDAIIKECAEQFYDKDFMEKLDAKQDVLVFENGVFDLSTMRFREGSPEDCASLTTQYAYEGVVDSGIREDIMGFIRAISYNDACAEYLLKVCAYMLHGHKYLEYFWFFCGKGRNGKGTLCALLEKTFGQYYYEPDITVVTTTKKSSSGANPEMAKARGKRVFCASEPDDEDKNAKFRVNKLKQLRGNDMIQARGLYKDFMEFRPQFGMIFQMNDKPDLSKADDAIARTLKIINFPWQFVIEPQESYQRKADPHLKAKFMDDVKYRQQFMLILLEYYDKYVRGCKFFEEPEEVMQATREYMDDNNPVAVWIKEKFTYTGQRGDNISCEKILADFNFDTKLNMGRRKFGEAMTALGHKSVNIGNKRCYAGFKRITEDDSDDGLE